MKANRLFQPHPDLGLLLVRLILGTVFIVHGYGKLTGLSGTADFLTSLGIPLPTIAAIILACTEFFGGLAMVFGFGVRLAGIPIAFAMLVAITMVHWKNGFSVSNGGYEYALTMMVLALTMVASGAGRYSLDHALEHHLPRAIKYIFATEHEEPPEGRVAPTMG